MEHAQVQMVRRRPKRIWVRNYTKGTITQPDPCSQIQIMGEGFVVVTIKHSPWDK